MRLLLTKLTFIILLQIFCTYCFAASVLVDGIYYSLSGNEATVTFEKQLQPTAIYTGDITVPGSVTYKNQSYTVTSIGLYAFYKCSLTSIKLPNTIRTIDKCAFNLCKSLTTIDIPNNIEVIGESAFAGCQNINDVSLGTGVKTIGKEAFWGCTALTNITCNATTPPSITETTFQNKLSVLVPENCGEAYSSATWWSGNEITEMKELPMAESLSFYKSRVFVLNNDSKKQEPHFTPSEAGKQTILWTSDNTEVATVDADGTVMTHAVGEAIITATTTDGSKLSASYKVMVVNPGIPGDVNGDGEITIADANEIVNRFLND